MFLRENPVEPQFKLEIRSCPIVSGTGGSCLYVEMPMSFRCRKLCWFPIAASQSSVSGTPCIFDPTVKLRGVLLNVDQ